MTTLTYTGERAIPWNPAVGAGVMIPHIARYAWACRYCWQKNVVDLGCGSGYGSFMLSWVARSVLAIDKDAKAIGYASYHFGQAGNLDFVTGDITTIQPAAEVYIAFEVLEHLDDPAALVDDLDGLLIWSMPVEVPSQFHKRSYTIENIKKLMAGSDFYYMSDGQLLRRDDSLSLVSFVLGIKQCAS